MKIQFCTLKVFFILRTRFKVKKNLHNTFLRPKTADAFLAFLAHRNVSNPTGITSGILSESERL